MPCNCHRSKSRQARCGCKRLKHSPDLCGRWNLGRYPVAFSKDQQLGHVTAYIIIDRQEGNLVWFTNYWTPEGGDGQNVEQGTGVINEVTGEITLVEVSQLESGGPPDGGSTGIFRLLPCSRNKYYLTYEGVGGGISFSTFAERA